ncbi:hypothetical protein [Desulfolutivibrio sulfoxidireducens]|uniref:hypothetical protein n=1 Tax=Desulfolutivibrio sulfoxidireducens TaxID=2773299 RepID=UPI00159E6D44|nr:hypothetical protein [Desulfolutivibrio sulfoxidireducens]QLA18954.1 hypothetical protein GD604_03990 [Desulfolutivibrio sulfoxidireducens]
MDRITCRECYFWNPARATDKSAQCRRYPRPSGEEGWPTTMEDGWCGEAKALEVEREYLPGAKCTFTKQPQTGGF